MNDLDMIQNTKRDVAVNGANPYSAYGAKVGQTGQFLSFKNGEYLAGQDSTEIPIGTRLVANMPGLRIGWRRWFDGQVTDDLTELLSDGRPVQRRDELGDRDQSQWERDDRGDPRDPWQLTNILEMMDAKGETYIYSTGSKGGIGAIGRLCKEYGREYRQRPGMLPIITLGRDFYNHPKFGKTYFPVFEIVGWTDADNPSLDGAAGDDVPFDPPAKPVPPVAAPAPAPVTNGARRAARF